MAYHIRSPTERQEGMSKEAYIISKWERKRKNGKKENEGVSVFYPGGSHRLDPGRVSACSGKGGGGDLDSAFQPGRGRV